MHVCSFEKSQSCNIGYHTLALRIAKSSTAVFKSQFGVILSINTKTANFQIELNCPSKSNINKFMLSIECVDVSQRRFLRLSFFTVFLMKY